MIPVPENGMSMGETSIDGRRDRKCGLTRRGAQRIGRTIAGWTTGCTGSSVPSAISTKRSRPSASAQISQARKRSVIA